MFFTRDIAVPLGEEMETYKILVTSDLHLSERIWKHRPIEGDSFYSWMQIQDAASEHKVDAVILAGDLLDKRKNSSESVTRLLQGLSRITAKNIPIIFNQGQHEMQDNPWCLANHNPLVQWVESPSFKDEFLPGVFLEGFDFKDKENCQANLEAANAGSADILVCHQVWEDFMGVECKPQAKFADVTQASILITGDYHEAICQEYAGLTVISPGSTHLRSIAEPVDKSFYLLELFLDGDDFEFQAQAVPLKTRRLFEVDATKKDIHQVTPMIEGHLCICDEYAVENDLPLDIRKPIFRLTYDKAKPEVAADVAHLFGTDCHLFYKVVSEDKEETDEFKLRNHTEASDRVSMVNCLDEYLNANSTPDAYKLAVKLLGTGEPEEVLASWVKEQINED